MGERRPCAAPLEAERSPLPLPWPLAWALRQELRRLVAELAPAELAPAELAPAELAPPDLPPVPHERRPLV